MFSQVTLYHKVNRHGKQEKWHAQASSKIAYTGLRLQRLAGRAHKIAQHGDVGGVSANPARVHRESEALGEIEIDSGIVEFRKTKPSGWSDAIHAGRIDGPRWPVALPGPARQFVELLPVSLVPSMHGSLVPSYSLDAAIAGRVRLPEAARRPSAAP